MRSSFLFLCAAISLVSTQSRADRKIMVGPHIGNASIITLRGINSSKAVVTFRRESEDHLETCTRESSKSPQQCMQDIKTDTRINERSANCPRATIYTEFGNFSMINHELEISRVSGKTTRLVRTDWKDHKTGQLVGNCSGCNTPIMIDTYRVLCPISFNDIARDGELY
jgi:hypothetical protein